jgi:hypothetical protein
VDGKLWVEPVGDLIIARVRGEPTAALLRQCHDQVTALAAEARRHRVLYDVLEMEAPPVDVPLEQWKLDKELGDLKLRRAIVVPNTRLAYLARLAFGDGEHRVFYSDMVAAVAWLSGADS